ncbi:ClpP-like prohead protease/major capsid protein fusion protein [Desulfobacula phenolica]|uniref:ATP-dependent Clp protease proteolytic subunit n=1 Tax=Desulfobacula phenolica TaxID=90732 RepID=A0A1H2I2I8_9BACT|nr:ClpP-like prohead protease/major capsid protein fusion protein [Desulfobacula phenolica]SDU38387.1 ATP-dependent protease ClpP, protease subunit [Desulfobacula phenolica]
MPGLIKPNIKSRKAKSNNKQLAKLRAGRTGGDTDFRVAATDNGVDVYLYDVIGWPFIEAGDLLYQIPKGVKTIHVHINSPGGDVFEGMAIYNLLTGHKAEVIVSVDGVAASSASLIAMAGDRINMSKASFMMIHNPWAMLSGDAQELRKEADLLDKISDVFAEAYCSKSGKSKQDVLAMMQAETWFTPAEAVESGLAHEITGEVEGSDISAAFDFSIFNNTPDLIRQGAAGSRQAQAKFSTKKQGTEDEMNKKLRALLERLGLAKESTEDQAWNFLAELDLDKIEDQEDKDRLIQALIAKTEPDKPGFTRADMEAAAKKAAQDERNRAATIRDDVRVAGLDDTFARELIDKDMNADQARQAIMDKMKTTNPPMGSGRFTVGETDHEKFKVAVADGLSFRTNARAKDPAPGHETFRAASIEFIARQCLERMGVNTQGLASRDQVAREILKRSGQGGGFSTDDFTSIFMDVANKSLLRAYQEAPATWRPIVNVVSASDFKTIYGVSLSDAPELELINEHGEYKEGKLSDDQESYSIKSYGKMVYLTRVMIVNDDLRAFTRIPQMYGSAARRKESDLVWGKITGNPVMHDGVALFHADHGNLETVAGNKGVVDSDKLDAGRKSMRLQTAPNGSKLDIRPAFLAVPVAQETKADIILRSAALPTADMSSGVHNPWAGKLTPISEPRLDDVSAKAWYLIGDPSQVDTIEVAYLDGNEQPYTEEQALFERDAVGYKIRHDVGVGVMDDKGLFKNPGE